MNLKCRNRLYEKWHFDFAVHLVITLIFTFCLAILSTYSKSNKNKLAARKVDFSGFQVIMSMDVSLLSQFSTETFSALLRQIPGDKDLILEAALMKTLDKLCGMSLLKSCGVKRVFKLEQNTPSNCANVVYLVWSSLQSTRTVIHQVW